MGCGRREFLKASGAAIASACLGGLCLHGCSPFGSVSSTALIPVGDYILEAGQVTIDLGNTPELTAKGGSVKLEFDHPEEGTPTKILLIHPEDRYYVAFANSCTHKRKELEYDHAEKELRCVSGHSAFDIKGSVLKGNAESPLKGYPTELEENTLIVKI